MNVEVLDCLAVLTSFTCSIAILLANPEERRAFIEEAAGVLKHRKRKREGAP